MGLSRLSFVHSLPPFTKQAGLVAAFFVTSAVPAAAAPPANAGMKAPTRVLIQTRAGLSDGEVEKAIRGHGGRRIYQLSRIGVQVVELPPGANAEAVARALSKNPHFKFAEPDYWVAPEFTPNDPYYGSSWHLPKIGAPAAWDRNRGQNVTIAVLDTGVDGSHPDLKGQLVPGWNFYDKNADTSDVHGHGTGVAGAAAASGNNSLGVASVAFNARIMPVRISRPDGYASFSTIANGLMWAADQGARVANISYAVSGSSTVRSAAQYMRNKGGLTVVAAGNDGSGLSIAPTDTMITVSATGSSDVLTSWSNYGDVVDVSAPGVSIYATSRGGGYGKKSGTSFASPVTAGVVALLKSARPELPASEIEKLLFASATDLGTQGKDQKYGWGRVHAGAALQAALGQEETPAAPPTVAITAPTGGTVQGLVPVNVSAASSVGIAKVDLLVNGVQIASDKTSPYGFSWDSAQTADGTAKLMAYAYDTAGNYTASSTVTVSIANGTSSGGGEPTTQTLDDPGATYVGSWGTTSNFSGFYGAGYHAHAPGNGSHTATWQAAVPAGSYRVYARWTAYYNRASDAPYTISHAGGQSTVKVSQKANGAKWNLLGTYTFGNTATIRLSSSPTGYVVADAIRLEPAN